ncbi:MAG TPA: MFS transporter, partial [Candidatus Thermoplasmatota archaeon]|nr:MFS transporter [Candidatus Thermoplasmatota archaeon]
MANGFLSKFAPFPRPFWTINTVELFERGAYYGMLAVLSTFLLADLGAPAALRGVLLAVQFPLLYFLPVVSGALADKFGFKKLLFATFATLIAGYAVLALSTTLWLAFVGILLYSVGAGLFKPMPAAVVTETSSEENRNFGFAIYYWMINLGAFLAPIGMQQVFGGELRQYFLVSAALSALNFAIVLVAWRDLKPAQPTIKVGESLARIGEIRKHPAFMALLIIYSGFWFMYAITTSFLQNYATDYGILTIAQVALLVPANALAILIVGPILSKLTGKVPALPLMIVGIVVFCAGFMLIGFVPTLLALFAGVFIFSVGEFLTHPSYLSYVSKISPQDKVALFFGFGFLPIGVGQMLGTLSGGFLYGAFAESTGRPQLFWVSIIAVGLLTVAALLVYNLVLSRRAAPQPAVEKRRRPAIAPFAAALALLLIPALVVTAAVQPAANRITPAGGGGLGDAGDLVALALDPVTGDAREGEETTQVVALPANA